MRKSVVYLFVSIFFLFTSCEYQLGENFVEIERPLVDSVLVDVRLNLPTDYEGEFYVSDTWLIGYTIDLNPKYKVEKCIFSLGEAKWENEEVDGSFLIDVDRFHNGRYELTCEVHARTNSGTVAGQMNTESVVEKRSWPLIVKARTESDQPLAYWITEEGYPEVFWEVDESLRDGFDHFTIEYSYENTTYIRRSKDFDQRSFVDKTYTGDGGIYRIYIYFKDETIRPYSLGQAVLKEVDTVTPENTPKK